MNLQSLQHVTLRPRDLEATRRFYERVIGLHVGERPPFGFPGYWLYVGEEPVLHLVGNDPPTDRLGSGAIDHIAFGVSGLAKARGRLEAEDIPYHEQTVPRLGLHQLFIEDPDGITIELNFPADEA